MQSTFFTLKKKKRKWFPKLQRSRITNIFYVENLGSFYTKEQFNGDGKKKKFFLNIGPKV